MTPSGISRPLARRCAQVVSAKFTRPLSFVSASSYCAKPADEQAEPVKQADPKSPALVWAAEQFSKWPSFTPNAGEDMFLLDQNAPDSALMAVSDGVGGWSVEGIDSSVFSKSLCHHLSKAYAQSEVPRSVSLMRLLDRAFNSVQQDLVVEAGSATACLVRLDGKTDKLDALNLGDSGFAVLRNNKVAHWQPSQQHFFNCPRQLSKIPKSMRSANVEDDLPKHADAVSLPLQESDVVVLMTDGVIDNVFPKEVLAIQAMYLSSSERKKHGDQLAVERFSKALTVYTLQVQRDHKRKSPFTIDAAKHRLQAPGGKIDDIAVVTALVNA